MTNSLDAATASHTNTHTKDWHEDTLYSLQPETHVCLRSRQLERNVQPKKIEEERQQKKEEKSRSMNKDYKKKKKTREMHCSIPLGNRVIFCIV